MNGSRFWMRPLIACLTLASTGAASYAFARLLWPDGQAILDVMLLLIFAMLFFWLAIAFWTATFGMVYCLLNPPQPAAPPAGPGDAAPLPRTAVIVPVYNEDPAHVFTGLLATAQSIQDAGHDADVDFFVLSDSTEPESWLAEEIAWINARQLFTGRSGFYYRHRARNVERKSGNIREFCQRWGSQYKYMVVYDADSIMAGSTVVEMIRRMEASPRVGILQTVPAPVNRQTTFARMQQFSASVYGQVFAAGSALWTHTESNYWGHNAIIRIRPFVEHCGLPTLPGRKPLGGEILSHDFVEAALMRRAGWQVCLATDLGGSYEECPTTLIDFAKRSRRWCQGNLQHLRLLLLHGFHPISRVHFGMGAMAYLSSVMWLLFIVIAVAHGIGEGIRAAGFLMTVTLALLLLPKAWGLVTLLRQPALVRAHGGALPAVTGVLTETILSALIAPILMIFNVVFVLSIFSGSSVRWDPQRRGDTSLGLSEAVHLYGFHTAIGFLSAAVVAWLKPETLPWLLPVLVGPMFSIPLAMLLSHVGLGRRLQKQGLFLIPEETETPEVLRQYEQFLPQMRQRLRVQTRADYFRLIVLDPALHDLHIGILRSQGEHAPSTSLSSVREVALHGGPEHLTRHERFALLSDEAALDWLHRRAWASWPLTQPESRLSLVR